MGENVETSALLSRKCPRCEWRHSIGQIVDAEREGQDPCIALGTQADRIYSFLPPHTRTDAEFQRNV